MTEGSGPRQIVTLIVALLAFIGGILATTVGSLLTSSYTLRAQELEFEQAAFQLSAQAAQEELTKLRELSYQFLLEGFLLLNQAIVQGQDPPIDPYNDAISFVDAGIALRVHSDPPLADATRALQYATIRYANAIGSEDSLDRSNEYGEAYAAWQSEYLNQVEAYTGRTVPEFSPATSPLEILGFVPTPDQP